MKALLFLACCCLLAEEKTLTFSKLSAAQDLQETATIVRSILDIPQASIDGRSLKVLGSAQQVAAAEWIARELDQPSGAKEKELSAGDTIGILAFNAAKSIQELQEAATLVRSIGEVRRLFTFNSSKKIVLRGTNAQIEQAAWILERLPLEGAAGPAELKIEAQRDSILRIYSLPQFVETRDLQWAITAIRSTAEIRYAFVYNSTRKAAFRGSAEQMAAVDFLLSEFKTTTATRHRMGRNGDFVRVFDGSKFAEVEERAILMRSMMDVRHVFSFPPGKKIVARGSKEEIDYCEWLMREDASELSLGLIRKFQLTFTTSVQELQEAGTMMRSVAEIRRVLAENETKTVIVRGSQQDIDFAAWLFGQLSSPPASGQAETRIENDTVRLVFLKPVDIPLKEFFQKVTAARRESGIPRVFTYNSLRAVVMRGSQEQVAKAESLLR